MSERNFERNFDPEDLDRINSPFEHVETSTGEEGPHDRLTGLADQMVRAVLHEPANHDVRAIVLLATDQDGGMGIHNYDDPTHALADLIMHAKATAQAVGISLIIADRPHRGSNLYRAN